MSKPDVLKMGLAQSFPGIDPRVWVTLAMVEAVTVTSDGVKADIVTIPEQRKETVMVAMAGADSGGGLYIPVRPGQVVIVEFPRGNSDEGGRISGSNWDPGDPPPSVVLDNPDDIALVGRAGITIRLVTSDDGPIVLESGGDTLLGTEDATLGVARLTDTVEVTIPPGTVIVLNPLFPGPGQPEFIPNIFPITLTGTITGASGKVRSS